MQQTLRPSRFSALTFDSVVVEIISIRGSLLRCKCRGTQQVTTLLTKWKPKQKPAVVGTYPFKDMEVNVTRQSHSFGQLSLFGLIIAIVLLHFLSVRSLVIANSFI